MSEARAGVPLPPLTEDIGPLIPWFCLDEARQREDGPGHDARSADAPPFKRRLRRAIQRVLAARRHPPYGENEYFARLCGVMKCSFRPGFRLKKGCNRVGAAIRRSVFPK
jgi:hypothetical protein